MKSLSAYYTFCGIAPLLLLISSRISPAASSVETSSSNSDTNTISTLRWASTGGGWRSQFACVGFANVFAQLDILSRFSAVSTTSGASWFSTQLFYSKEFYDRVALAEDSQALHDFVVEWMESYGNMLTDSIQDTSSMTEELSNTICNVTDLGNGDVVQDLSDLCRTLVYFDGDWAAFVKKMLVYAAESYGDSDFANHAAGSDNRLEVFKGTDLLIQAALAANSRIRSNNSDSSDVAVYIGPVEANIYTVPISAAYIVNASGTSYRYSTESLQGDMTVSTSQTSSQHSFSDWEDFYLYPADNGTVHINGEGHSEIANGDTFSQAFGGGDSTVIQVAAISSAAAGMQSPLVPSTFTQRFSERRYQLLEEDATIARLNMFDKAVSRQYNQTLLDGFAVCSQWPNPCGSTDGLYVDGWVIDNPALVINVGQYHISGEDLSKTMKVILTNTNEEWGEGNDFQYTQILQYFESPINQNVEPGSFNWPPGMWDPYQSPQIFEEFMDSSTLDSLIEPTPGSNMTTAILKGTTIDIPIFGIMAGQQVEILLIILNEPITTYIATPDSVELYTEPLADMTKHIAENEELASRIKAFVEPLFDDNDGTESPADNDGVESPPAESPDNNDGVKSPPPTSGQSTLQVRQFPTVAALSGLFLLSNVVMV
mmetsp:Transcript_30398/g.64340  ORF Transcript_30398/g.64340 Transcript_30398/m.64340 type:complete len:656 (+) Transcript_30398:96-2063(+)